MNTAPFPAIDCLGLPESLQSVLRGRGLHTTEQWRAHVEPSLDALASPDRFPDMAQAVERIRASIEAEETIAIYADRDVDGLTGLAILTRTLRTLGGHVVWASPQQGRGVQESIVDSLLAQNPTVMIFVDCGSGETAALKRLAEKGVATIVADHHRLASAEEVAEARVFAWIHPGAMDGHSDEAPAGCVMAFKLAQALLVSFLGNDDKERLDYFLFDHLDLLALGILADRVSLKGENRIFVWHGLRRLAQTRKGGLNALLRLFRLLPRGDSITVREATWRIIPMLNAAGRLGQPQWASDLLLTEESWTARDCIDQLLELNSQRRDAQKKSLEAFERMVAEQCDLENDSVLVAVAAGLEPSVTGLAAQALARQHGRPVFLFVTQRDDLVGSARGNNEGDLYAWVEEHSALILKFGGHQGAVGMTLRRSDYEAFREGLRASAKRLAPICRDVAPTSEADLHFGEADDVWWGHLKRLEPFGQGFPCPVFRLTNIETIRPLGRPRAGMPHTSAQLEGGGRSALAEFEPGVICPKDLPGPWTMIAYPVAGRKGEPLFKWRVQEVRPHHG